MGRSLQVPANTSAATLLELDFTANTTTAAHTARSLSPGAAPTAVAGASHC